MRDELLQREFKGHKAKKGLGTLKLKNYHKIFAANLLITQFLKNLHGFTYQNSSRTLTIFSIF